MQRLRRHISYLKHAQLQHRSDLYRNPVLRNSWHFLKGLWPLLPSLEPQSACWLQEKLRGSRSKWEDGGRAEWGHITLSCFSKEQDPELPLTNKSKSEIQKWQILLDSTFHEEVFVFLASWVPENRWLLYKLSTLLKPSASHSKPPLVAFSTASLCSHCLAIYFYLTWHWSC